MVLVIITPVSIYGKKNSEIRYPLVFCLHRTRSSLTMEVNLGILKRKEPGEGMSAISQNLGLAQSTVWTVLKNNEAIKKKLGRMQWICRANC
ncbi:hypothetical protein E2C01_041579 [Portunus trituberculatus]|uniref:HTH psq-type domain-containing protein n=1 Tax=Portunus trituberculatus TaxID=210409 RepID=A0A5B7FKC6_PORTR|nr:hypothetical protein [Portunus trituberculatus]